MALQIWLPLMGDVHNQGLYDEMSFNNATAQVSASGCIGSCYSFTATTGSGIYSTPSNVETFMTKFVDNHSFSFCAFFKTTATTSTPIAHITYGLRFFVGASTSFSMYNSSRNIAVNANTATNDGKWHHYAATYDLETNTMSIYVDGQLKNSRIYTAGATYVHSWTNYFYVGRDPNNSTANAAYFYNGSVNDVRFYDHCLSAKEVKEISKGLVLHYKLNSGCAVSKNLVNGTITGGSINQGTITVTDGIATINNTSGSWCRVRCQDEAESNTNLANNNVANKTITVSFDILMISGNVPRIFISDSYRGVTGVDKTQIGVWQRGYCTYVHPGYSSSYNYFSPHFSSLGNYQIKDIKIVLGDIKDYYSSYNEGNIVYDSSGYGRHGTFTNTLSASNESPKYNNGVLSENSVITCTNFSLPDGPSTISFWNKPSVSATENTSRMTVRFGKFEYFTYLNYPYFIHDTDYRYKYVNYWLDGNWHFVTCVYDGTNVMIYIDGEQLSLSVTTTTRDYQNNLAITPIGESVSDFRVYSTALSAEDVAELYHTAASVDNKGNFYCYELKEV